MGDRSDKLLAVSAPPRVFVEIKYASVVIADGTCGNLPIYKTLAASRATCQLRLPASFLHRSVAHQGRHHARTALSAVLDGEVSMDVDEQVMKATNPPSAIPTCLWASMIRHFRAG